MLKLIYCPNKAEQFTAALRLIFQKLIIKNGIKKNYITALRKIYEFEVLIGTYIEPIDIEVLCSELLTAVFLKKKFNYYIKTDKNYLINKKCFTALLLNICCCTDYIEIIEINKSLVIKGNFDINNKIMQLVKKLNGKVLKEVIEKNIYLCFSFTQTEKKSEDFEAAYSLLQNPLSVVNLYLTD